MALFVSTNSSVFGVAISQSAFSVRLCTISEIARVCFWAESCRCEVAAASEGDCRVRFQNHVVPHCSQASLEFMEHSR